MLESAMRWMEGGAEHMDYGSPALCRAVAREEDCWCGLRGCRVEFVSRTAFVVTCFDSTLGYPGEGASTAKVSPQRQTGCKSCGPRVDVPELVRREVAPAALVAYWELPIDDVLVLASGSCKASCRLWLASLRQGGCCRNAC